MVGFHTFDGEYSQKLIYLQHEELDCSLLLIFGAFSCQIATATSKQYYVLHRQALRGQAHRKAQSLPSTPSMYADFAASQSAHLV